MSNMERLKGQNSGFIYPVFAGTQENFNIAIPAQAIFLQIAQREDSPRVIGIKIGDGSHELKDLPFVNWYDCFAKEDCLIINKQEFNKEE